MSQALFTQIDQDLAEAEDRVTKLRAVRETLASLYGEPTPDAAPTKMRVAGGSIPDRILWLLKDGGGSLTLPVLVEGAKARKPQVKAALEELLDAHRVNRTGKSRGTRYVLPGWRPDGAE